MRFFNSCFPPFFLTFRTLPGRWHAGVTTEDATQPPLLPGSTTARYDSVADSSSKPGLVIIFDENKILPEYIVTII